MELKMASAPFRFVTQVSVTQMTQWKAKNIYELLSCLKEVPGSVIYHHTHRFLKQHQFLLPEPPNDFAYWVDTALQDEKLAEKLFAIDTIRFPTIRDIREKVVQTIEEHLISYKNHHDAPAGDEFYFKQSISFVLPTPYETWNLSEFAEALKKVSINSLYHHIFEARIRPPLEINDFSNWFETALGETKLAEAISKMDPYTHTLEGLRHQVINLVERRIQEMMHV
ncbi:MAG: hypothetical protein HYT97_02590 [Elusimicrobia bacterium]|nr:hypothetical protein [Elusimicrobiota bacterium]